MQYCVEGEMMYSYEASNRYPRMQENFKFRAQRRWCGIVALPSPTLRLPCSLSHLETSSLTVTVHTDVISERSATTSQKWHLQWFVRERARFDRRQSRKKGVLGEGQEQRQKGQRKKEQREVCLRRWELSDWRGPCVWRRISRETGATRVRSWFCN